MKRFNIDPNDGTEVGVEDGKYVYFNEARAALDAEAARRRVLEAYLQTSLIENAAWRMLDAARKDSLQSLEKMRQLAAAWDGVTRARAATDACAESLLAPARETLMDFSQVMAEMVMKFAAGVGGPKEGVRSPLAEREEER